MKLVSRQCVHKAPRPGTLAYELVFNSHNMGNGKARVRMLDISDDVHDALDIAFSDDGGRTWPRALPVQMAQKNPGGKGGVLRRSFADLFVDPVNDRQILFTLEGLFRHDNASEGFGQYYLRYRTSEDGGMTTLVDEPVIQRGYTADHPLPGQWVGHNGVMNPGGNSTVRLPDGKLLVATVRTIMAPDGKWWNPAGSYGFFEILMLFGRWSDERLGAIDWTAGPVVSIDTKLSPRGIFEPTLALMRDGRLLMVSRGSNGSESDPDHQLPSRKWKCVSVDGGATWSDPEPWTYSDGTDFYSPSSISTFVQHSNGVVYWVGNLSAQNCQNNMPRDHLYIGRVDEQTLGLVKDSVFLIDRRQPGEPDVQLACMLSAHEDRQTRQIVVNVPRYVQQTPEQWGGDSYEYRIAID